MISASKSALSLNNLKFYGPKLWKILRIFVRSFANPHPVLYNRPCPAMTNLSLNLKHYDAFL